VTLILLLGCLDFLAALGSFGKDTSCKAAGIAVKAVYSLS
jgi:hypothetical protein